MWIMIVTYLQTAWNTRNSESYMRDKKKHEYMLTSMYLSVFHWKYERDSYHMQEYDDNGDTQVPGGST